MIEEDLDVDKKLLTLPSKLISKKHSCFIVFVNSDNNLTNSLSLFNSLA